MALTVGDAVKLCRLESLSCGVCGVRAGARFATRLARSAILHPTGTAASNVSFLRKEISGAAPALSGLCTATDRSDSRIPRTTATAIRQQCPQAFEGAYSQPEGPAERACDRDHDRGDDAVDAESCWPVPPPARILAHPEVSAGCLQTPPLLLRSP